MSYDKLDEEDKKLVQLIKNGTVKFTNKFVEKNKDKIEHVTGMKYELVKWHASDENKGEYYDLQSI